MLSMKKTNRHFSNKTNNDRIRKATMGELIEPVKKLKNRVLIMNDKYKSTWRLKDFLVQQAINQTSSKNSSKKSLLDVSYREFLIEKQKENKKTKLLMSKLPTIHEDHNKINYNNRQNNYLLH